MVASPHHIELPNYPFIRIIPLTLLPKYFLQKQKEKSFQSSPTRLNAKAPSMPILPRKLAPFNAILIITLGVYQTPLQHTQMVQNGMPDHTRIPAVQSFLRMLGNKGVQNSPTPSQLLAKVIPAVQSFLRA